MKKTTTLLIIGILFLNSSFGQEIEMKLNLFGYKFVQNGEKLNWKELVKATESNYEANLLIKKAKTHNLCCGFSFAEKEGFEPPEV